MGNTPVSCMEDRNTAQVLVSRMRFLALFFSLSKQLQW